jgi:hypothetical protein
MLKMTDFNLFLLCIFGVILLIIGLSIFEFSNYNACIHACDGRDGNGLETCKIKCSHRRQLKSSYEAGITFMIFGSILTLCSFPIVTLRLSNNISFGNKFGNKRNVRAELTKVVEVDEKTNTDDLANLQEQLKAQTAQIQTFAERLSQVEKSLQETTAIELHPLGNEKETDDNVE